MSSRAESNQSLAKPTNVKNLDYLMRILSILFRGLKIEEFRVEIFSHAKDRNALRFFEELNSALEVEANRWLSIQVYETVKLAFDASVVDLFFDLDLISNEEQEIGLLYTDSCLAISTAIVDDPNNRSTTPNSAITPEKTFLPKVNEYSGVMLTNTDKQSTTNLSHEIEHLPLTTVNQPELHNQSEYTGGNLSVSRELVLIDEELVLIDEELVLTDDGFLVADDIYAIDEDDYASEEYFFIPELDELKTNPCDPIFGSNQVSREYRAKQKALDFIAKYEWGLKDLDIVFKVFMQSGWSATRVALERESERGLTPDGLMLALSLKNFWASEERFWISFARNGSYQLSQYIMSWPTALAIIKSFESYPQEEELHLLMDDYLDYWMNHKILHKVFPSFRLFLWFRFFDEKSTLPATENGFFQHNDYCPSNWEEGTDIIGFRLQQDMDAYGIERVHVSSKHLRFGKNDDREIPTETPDQNEAEEE